MPDIDWKAAVRAAFGARTPAVMPPPSGASSLASMIQDARYALRLMGRQPAHTFVVIATMALGIAATTLLGSITYGVLLKPLPWADAPRLVRLYETRQGSTRRFRPMMTNGTYRAWREGARTLDGLAAWDARQVAVPDRPGASRITVCDVTPSLFPLLQAAPVRGRAFVDGEEEPGRPPIVILSYGLWQQQFGGRPDVIGARIRFDTTTYTVVGVMPASFAFPDRETRAWLPFYIEPPTTPDKAGVSISMFQALGRLRPGATAPQAAAEGTALGRAAIPAAPHERVVAIAVFGSDGPVDVTVVPMLQALTGDVRPALLILLAAVALLLTVAIANVASLQLARATARRRELALRSALGAGRGRLVRQTLVENLVLGLFAGGGGLALAALLHRALPSVLPANFPRLDDVAFDWRILAFAAALSILAGLGCAVLPALHIARSDIAPALGEDALAPVGGGFRAKTARARAVILAGQMAMACVLLVGAVLLVRSFVDLMNAELGYDPSNVLTARVILTDGEYSPERRFAVLDDLVQRLSGTPGVTHVAYSNSLPFVGGEALSSFPLKRRDGSIVQVQTGVQSVSPDYFAAMGQRIVDGRGFSPDDASRDVPVAIVNREFSRKYLEGQALGWTLPSASKPGVRPSGRPIVGIVEDAVRRSVTDTPQPEIYGTPRRSGDGAGRILDSDINLIVRTSADPRELVPVLRGIVQAAAPTAPLESIMTMRDRVAGSLANPRLYAVVLATFAGFALLIAAVGLFGVLSYTVALRRREIGVRSALGATGRDIVILVATQSLVIVAAGIAVGLLASAWATRLLGTLLYGVTTHDAVSFALVAAVLFAAAAVATIVPARRAAYVDPAKVLRG
ncbi:MAG TPA: ADOP family duplicated permease [Vicinamibacterales bacterium]|nr:ADOP family duplicated permease [Vicinamibacterales bacterium]